MRFYKDNVVLKHVSVFREAFLSPPPPPWDWELGTEKVYPALDLAEALEAASMNPTARAERSGKFHGALDES